jgi:hypothetical protein
MRKQQKNRGQRLHRSLIYLLLADITNKSIYIHLLDF